MHPQALTRPTLYEQLEALPAGLTGEILDGQLYVLPRPSLPHGLAATSLADELVSPFQTFEAISINLDDLWAPTA